MLVTLTVSTCSFYRSFTWQFTVICQGLPHQDRRHNILPNQPDRRLNLQPNYHNVNDRRLMPGLADRRHISPPLHINICDNNSGPSDNMHPRGLMDFSQRMNARDMIVSPVHFQHQSPQYYRQASDDSIKSESPSRKRRRLSRSGHHLDMQGPPSPPRRSPRQHLPSTSHHQMQVSVCIILRLVDFLKFWLISTYILSFLIEQFYWMLILNREVRH